MNGVQKNIRFQRARSQTDGLRSAMLGSGHRWRLESNAGRRHGVRLGYGRALREPRGRDSRAEARKRAGSMAAGRAEQG